MECNYHTLISEFSELLKTVRETIDLGPRLTKIEVTQATIENKLDRALAGRYTPEQSAELEGMKEKLNRNDAEVDAALKPRPDPDERFKNLGDVKK